MVESTNTPNPTQGQASGEAGVATTRTAGCGQSADTGQTAKPSRKRPGLTTGSAVMASGWCGGSTRRQTVLHGVLPSLHALSIGTNNSRHPGCGSACPLLCGRSRQPALRERVSITPRKAEGVNPQFATDRTPTLAESPAECYRFRPDPPQSRCVRPITGERISRTTTEWDCNLTWWARLRVAAAEVPDVREVACPSSRLTVR